ncbi:MAG: hypothetical protein HXS52_11850 [Theionarchaea archaeon]|nr:hypothetical protein [Theionarchaea archaeon]
MPILGIITIGQSRNNPEKLNLNPDAPFIVQFAIFVQNGVFWHMLIDSIGAVM